MQSDCRSKQIIGNKYDSINNPEIRAVAGAGLDSAGLRAATALIVVQMLCEFYLEIVIVLVQKHYSKPQVVHVQSEAAENGLRAEYAFCSEHEDSTVTCFMTVFSKTCAVRFTLFMSAMVQRSEGRF